MSEHFFMNIKPVDNWQKGLKWFSTWAFALIIFIATTPIPDELLSLLNADGKRYAIALVALCGLILRFVNQTSTVQTSAGER